MKTPEKSGVFSYDDGLFQAHIPVHPEPVEGFLHHFRLLRSQGKPEYQFY
jgi:hypothetical protein